MVHGSHDARGTRRRVRENKKGEMLRVAEGTAGGICFVEVEKSILSAFLVPGASCALLRVFHFSFAIAASAVRCARGKSGGFSSQGLFLLCFFPPCLLFLSLVFFVSHSAVSRST